MSNVCQNCGYTDKANLTMKEFTDGDGLPIMIEVCKYYRQTLDKGEEICYNETYAKEN